MGVRRKHIREAAETVLRKFHIKGGEVDVASVIKMLGIELREELVDDDLSGFLLREPGKKPVIGVNARHHPNRRKFTLAHELGHYLLHEAERVHLDGRKPGYRLQRDKKSASGESLIEREANLFAAELLMPAAFLDRDLRGQHVDLVEHTDVIRELAAQYGVSVEALTIRLQYLGYVQD